MDPSGPRGGPTWGPDLAKIDQSTPALAPVHTAARGVCILGLARQDYTLPPMNAIVILISGRGSNLQAIAQACAQQAWPARICGVISNRPDAPGLALAQTLGLATAVVDHRAHASRESFEHALQTCLDAWGANWVVLAGFMRVLTPGFVQRHEGRMVNIHPSLLPAFGGLNTHQRAIDAGCRVAGATVHLVTPELDHGPIIAQATVAVRNDDSAASLGARVLALEHRLYPLALGWLMRDELRLDGQRVLHKGGQAQWLCEHDLA